MDGNLTEIAAIAAGLFLRIGLPLGLTFLLAWLLRRLDARWHAQAQAENVRLRERIAAGETGRHCWEINGCPPRLRARCVAFQNPGIPCWEARSKGGLMRPACRDCGVRLALAPAHR